MNRYRILIASLLALAVVLLFMALRHPRPLTGEGAPVAVAAEGKPPAAPGQAAAVKPARPKAAARGRPAAAGSPAAEAAGAESPEGVPGEGSPAAEAKTPRERSVAAWESLVDQVIEQKEVPAAEQATRVKEAFDQLDKEDQMDGIRRSLNLFPDEQFPALYAILFDKTEDPDVLDAIFSDALNRPEEIKNPLMRELRRDREHPMFFESARILDVVEPKDEKGLPAPTPSP